MVSFLGVFSSETTSSYSFHTCPVYATLSAHLIFLDLITPPVFGAVHNLLSSFLHSFIAACSFLPPWHKYPPQLPVLTQHSLHYSSKSPTRCNNFPVNYSDVYLQLNIFRAGPTTNTARLSPRYEGKPRGCHSSHWAPDDGRENARNMLSCK
jgi:hypothetical protein